MKNECPGFDNRPWRCSVFSIRQGFGSCVIPETREWAVVIAIWSEQVGGQEYPGFAKHSQRGTQDVWRN